MSNPIAIGSPGGKPAFCHQVERQFGRQAAHYNGLAQLQQGLAWRLAHHCSEIPIPPGPRADLGAGTGLLGSAWLGPHPSPLLQLDLCPELLALNPHTHRHGSLVWDLNNGLPPALQPAALLASSFSLQWLDAPGVQLDHWCRSLQPGGWLALAVPTNASFSPWRLASQRAAVPFTALDLPDAAQLIDAMEPHLELQRCQRLRFSRHHADGLSFLRQIRQLGAGASRHTPLTAGQLRRLLQHWPSPTALNWEVLFVLGQRRAQSPGPARP